jgi:ABC transporter substrate binding protein (PQQ-dependent alcohol dehydrogenase system)
VLARFRSLFLVCLLAMAIPMNPSISSEINLVYIGHRPIPKQNPLPLDEGAPDEGVAGAQLGISDDSSTGRFTGQTFALQNLVISGQESAGSALKSLPTNVSFVIADLPASELSEAARHFPNLIFLNAGARDDSLRGKDCLSNVLHTIPSRAMLADGLAQYLIWKKWRRWFLVVGPDPADRLYAAAIERAAVKFGAKIIAKKDWTFQTANAHADTGHATLQMEIPAFTRIDDYDVLIVADEPGMFGHELIGRTFLPRPVAGTQGLVAAGWSPVNVEWGALQLQNRFYTRFKRHMTEIDYAAWLAARVVGEAAVRARSVEAKSVLDYLTGPDFLVSGFKGPGQSFRSWDGQMRQAILIAGPEMLVSASPQAGFLHRTSVLDTLGVDKDESRCRR